MLGIISLNLKWLLQVGESKEPFFNNERVVFLWALIKIKMTSELMKRMGNMLVLTDDLSIKVDSLLKALQI